MPSGMNCWYWRQFLAVIVVPIGIAPCAVSVVDAAGDTLGAGCAIGVADKSAVPAAKTDASVKIPNAAKTIETKSERKSTLITPDRFSSYDGAKISVPFHTGFIVH
jgi:hypothetical protein